MESALLGLVLDSSVPIAAERRKLTARQAIESVRKAAGEIPIVLCALSIAEIGHGIYRANTPEIRARRRGFPRRVEVRCSGSSGDGGYG
jgi:hypothetical protein